MRLRFTIRRLLLVVALAAVVLTGYLGVRRLQYRAGKLETFARMESNWADGDRDFVDLPWTSEAKKKAHLKAAEWHDQRAALYRESVWRPWIEVPNVPEPTFR